MAKTFKNAPLVEIIAELRWNPPITSHEPQVGQPLLPLTNQDEFFMRFGGRCYQSGFQRTERLLPSGFPAFLGQVVYRYKRGTEKDSELYQIGSGIFSANALPPYRSWDEFSPVVEDGVNALLETRNDAEKVLPFSSASVRYIDAFGEELLKGRDIQNFISDILGFKLELPAAFTGIIANESQPKCHVQLSIPVMNDMMMNVTVGEGLVNNNRVVLLDTTVVSSTQVNADVKSVMERLNAARGLIHDMFMKLTVALHDDMKPSE